MNGHATGGVRRAPTQAEMEVKYLRQEVKGLYQVNESLKKKLDDLDRRSGWEKFQDSLLSLGQHRIDDAIAALLAHRKQFRDKHEISRQDKVFQTEHGIYHTEHGVIHTDHGGRFADNGVPHADNGVSHADGEVLQTDHRALPTDLRARFAGEHQPPPPAIPNHGIKRSSTQPAIATAAQTEVRKQVRQRPSRQSLRQSLRPSLRRVGSARELATKFAAFFKKGKKDKEKERADDVVKEEEEQDNSKQMFQEPVSQNRVAVETPEHSHKPYVRKMGNKKIIKGKHQNLLEWKLQLAEEKVQLLQQQNELDSSSAPDRSSTKINRRHPTISTTKNSRELEAGMVAAMEQDLRAFPRNRGSVRQFDWPEGSRASEDVFNNNPQDEESRSQKSASRAHERRSLPLAPATGYVGPAGKNPNRYTQFYLPRKGDYSPPASPPPTKPLPAIPEATRPFPRPPTRPPPPPPVQGEDDVFGTTSRPKTPPTAAAQQGRRLRSTRRRKSEPSPTPRFIVHRPDSPSPGGNGPLGETPKPSWMNKET